MQIIVPVLLIHLSPGNKFLVYQGILCYL